MAFHLEGDHIFGLLPLMASCMNGAGGTTEDVEDPRAQANLTQPPLEIYGPLGTRAYVRNGLQYTHTLLGGPYVVHELRLDSDPLDGDHTALSLHPFELPNGQNILQINGVWQHFYKDDLVTVSAARILHSVECIGFVVHEHPISGKMDPQKYIPHIKRTKTPLSVLSRLQRGESVGLSDGTMLHGPARRPGRKIVILGDTYDPSPIAHLASSANILIHEATNAHLPGLDLNTKAGDTFESVEERAKSRGHSTPQMAGAFAKMIGARKLVMNHFSPRYAGDDDKNEDSKKIMEGIAALAASEYDGDIVCARDFMRLDIEKLE